MKYLKRPLEVDAIQWTGTTDVKELLNTLGVNKIEITRGCAGALFLSCEGIWGISPYDYIIKYSSGTLDHCSQDVFDRDYTPVGDDKMVSVEVTDEVAININGKTCIWNNRECEYEEWFKKYCDLLDRVCIPMHEFYKVSNPKEYNNYLIHKESELE